MQPSPPTAVPAPPATRTDPVRLLAGLLLVLPAGIGLLVGQVWPTLRTVQFSLQDRSILGGGSGAFTGLDNYSALDAGRIAEVYGAGLLLPLLPLVALLLVGPLLGFAAYRAGRVGRWTTRLVLAVPMVCFAPAAIAAAWAFEHGFGGGDARTAFWLGSFGLAAGLGVTGYLAVLRGRGPGRSGWPAGSVVGVVAGLAAVAVGLQAFAYPLLLGEITPVPQVWQFAFQLLAFGPAAASGTILFTLLLVLGVVAALVMILSGLRLTIEPTRPDPGPGPGSSPSPGPGPGSRSLGAAVATGLGLLVVLAVAGYGLWPWLSRLGQLDTGGEPAGTVLVNTWLPPLLSTVVGVGSAALAGFGIGALRPLGRWSELLLLPFAPWLFVGIGPLVVAKYDAAVNGVFGDRAGTFLGLVPPVWLVVPALFLFTLLFRGLAERPRQPGEPAGYGRMVVTGLPMLALAGGATWLVQSQSLLWGLTIGFGGDHQTGPTLALGQASRLAAGDSPIGLVLPIPLLVIFAGGLAVLQLLYLDRLAIRTGRAGQPT